MAFILDDAQLEMICDRSAGLCGYNCIKCEAFAANRRYHDGYRDFDDEDDNEY